MRQHNAENERVHRTLIVAPAINAGVIGHVSPEGHSETGLCQISNRSAARRNGNWKMALRDRRPKPVPQGPKCHKPPVRDWGAPA
jgi:hypothetical protein